MNTLPVIQDFLAQQRLAIVGVSREPKGFSRTLLREFRGRGYNAIAVNPQANEIDGQPCFHSLREVHPPVESVLLMTSPAGTDAVVEQLAETRVKRVWMYRAGGAGAVSPSAVEFCKSHGIAVIAGECPFMFFPGGSWFHRLHGLVKKITASYPA